MKMIAESKPKCKVCGRTKLLNRELLGQVCIDCSYEMYEEAERRVVESIKNLELEMPSGHQSRFPCKRTQMPL